MMMKLLISISLCYSLSFRWKEGGGPIIGGGGGGEDEAKMDG